MNFKYYKNRKKCNHRVRHHNTVRKRVPHINNAFDKRMTITNRRGVRFADVFVCTAAPYWDWKPESVDVAEHQNVTFRCKGEGRPTPRVEWLINGVPVSGEFL